MLDWITNMTPGGLLATIGGLFVALSTLVEISPIKLNPWSWIAKKIGRAINGEVLEKVDKLEKDIQAMQDVADERNAKAARTRVLRFGDEIIHEVKHSKEHFDDILLDISNYDRYCAEHPHFENDRMQLTAQLIKDTYRKCMEDHSFI